MAPPKVCVNVNVSVSVSVIVPIFRLRPDLIGSYLIRVCGLLAGLCSVQRSQLNVDFL